MIMAIITACLQAAVFYINALVLVPKLYERKALVLYFGSVIILAALVIGMDTLVFRSLVRPQMLEGMGDKLLEDVSANGFPIRPPFEGNHSWILPIMKNISGLLIPYLGSWLYVSKMWQDRRSKQEAKLKEDRMEAEMKFLKSQINPHFLFNTLNNIYSLSRKNSDKTPELIMKLSKMLRYNLYECNARKVSLEQEIAYVNHFISFQRLKTKDPQNIQADFAEVDLSVMVAPLLFIPFLENSFKHSYIENIKTGWVSIGLRTDGGTIRFTISNSIPESRIRKDRLSGIGLENVKRRLELEYPGKHLLEVKSDSKEFSVVLIIET